MSIQRLIDKETSELTSRIEDLQSRADKLKKELKKKKENESSLNTDLENMRKVKYQSAIIHLSLLNVMIGDFIELRNYLPYKSINQ